MTPTPIGDRLTALATADPTRPAVTSGDRTLTRAQLESTANRLARHYAQSGVRRGDFVSIGLPNGIEFIQACYASWKLGAVPQPVPAKLPARELARILRLAEPTLLVGFPKQVLADLPEDLSEIPDVELGATPDQALSDAALPSTVSPAWKASTSGGSTGGPKLIVAGKTSEIDPAGFGTIFRMRSDQVQLIPGPLHHNGPFSAAFLGSLLGQHIVIMPRFDAEEALNAIRQYGVNYVNLVPTMMHRMLRLLDERPDSYDLGSLQTVWHSAAPCPPWLKERWIELVGGDTVYENYGGTEAQAVTVISGDEWLTHRGSAGRPVVGEIRIAGPAGETLAPGEVGLVMLRRPAGTPPTYRYVGVEAAEFEDGWETLGDLGRFDEEGYLYLADRRTDMVLSGGSNVYPAEVEAAIGEHPLVLSSVAVGLADDDLGQRVHAIVQTAGDLDEETLRAFVAERLVGYKRPRSYRFVTEPLRDEAGKVRRSALRDAEQEREAR